jgi:hypothetical protein
MSSITSVFSVILHEPEYMAYVNIQFEFEHFVRQINHSIHWHVYIKRISRILLKQLNTGVKPNPNRQKTNHSSV